MIRWGRVREWWNSAPARWSGRHIPEGETLTRLSSSATFDPAEKIVSFYLANKGKVTKVKALRMVEEQPDTFVKPADISEDLPIG
jgi:hypothetical protein